MNTPLIQLPSTEFGPVLVPKNNVETLYSGTKVGNASLVHMVSMIAAIDAIAIYRYIYTVNARISARGAYLIF